MNKKIAVPTTNGKLDEHFGHCKYFTIFEINDINIVSETNIDAPPHQPGFLPPWLAEKGVTDVIAGGMGHRAIQIFNSHKINVFVGAPKLPARELIEGFMNNTLTFSANYCDH